MNPSPSFNFVQSVFELNMLSNLVSDNKNTAPNLQEDLSTMLIEIFGNADFQKVMGTWSLEWGPVVGEYGSDVTREYASNALYVAKNQEGQYVIATSATNPASFYGWFVEDFETSQMVPWIATNTAPNAPRISVGTSTGLAHLLAMVDNGGVSLMQYLTNTFSTSAVQTQLVVTGHSLGGALSPVLALYIDQAQSHWNPASTVIVTTMPTAGASPGNQAFSDYQNAIMGPRTLRFWNKLDPVPHGWQPDMVEQVPFLYYPYYKPGLLLKAIAGLVVAQSLEGTKPYPAGGFYTNLQPQVSPLPGQVNITAARNPSATQVLQFFIDLGADEIFKALNFNNGFEIALIMDALNWVVKTFADAESLDKLLDQIEAKLANLPGHDVFLKDLVLALEIILTELENLIVFLLQLCYQHVTTYPDLMGTYSIHPLTASIIDNLVDTAQLNANYKNVMDRLFDPVAMLKAATGAVGVVVKQVLTVDFIKSHPKALGY